MMGKGKYVPGLTVMSFNEIEVGGEGLTQHFYSMSMFRVTDEDLLWRKLYIVCYLYYFSCHGYTI